MTRHLVLNDLNNPLAHSQRCASRCLVIIGKPNSSTRYLSDAELATSIGVPDSRLTSGINYVLMHRDAVSEDFPHAAQLRILLHAVLGANPKCHCFVLGNSGQVLHGVPLQEAVTKFFV